MCRTLLHIQYTTCSHNPVTSFFKNLCELPMLHLIQHKLRLLSHKAIIRPFSHPADLFRFHTPAAASAPPMFTSSHQCAKE